MWILGHNNNEIQYIPSYFVLQKHPPIYIYNYDNQIMETYSNDNNYINQ
jgi:hypothetical protein